MVEKSKNEKQKQAQNPASATADRTMARAAKEQVSRMEMDNLGAVILWRSNDRWWKMCANSTLIYAYYVAPMCEKKPKIHPDKDRYFNSRDGVISIANMDKLREDLARHKIKEKKISETVTMFVLPKPLAKEEIEGFRREERGKREKINEILGGENLNPYLNSESWKLLSAIYHFCCKMSKPQEAMIGAKLRDEIIEIMVIRDKIERKETGRLRATEEIYEHTGRLMSYWRICYEMNFVETEKAERIALHLFNMRTETRKMLKEMRREKTNEYVDGKPTVE